MNFLQAAAAASSLFIFLVWQRYTKNNLNVNVEQYILQEADFPYFMDRPQFFSKRHVARVICSINYDFMTCNQGKCSFQCFLPTVCALHIVETDGEMMSVTFIMVQGGRKIRARMKFSIGEGQIHLRYLQINKYLMDDSSVNFHDKVFLHFLLKFTKNLS